LAVKGKEISVIRCCRHLGISKQSYYKSRKRVELEDIYSKEVLEKVSTIRYEQPRIGTRKLYYLLKEEINIGRDKLFRLLRNNEMLVVPKKKHIKTTNSRHWMQTYRDISKTINLESPEQLWVSDITYLSTKEETIYLHLVTDAYSKHIMGYNLSRDLTSQSTLKALQMALGKRIYKNKNLVHHSDRGLQYCSRIYVEELLKNNCKISMTEDGSPYDNAVAERVNGILKDEFYCDEKFPSFEQAKRHIDQSIVTYNCKRPHISCRMLTPKQMHLQSEVKVRKWNKKISHPKREIL